MKLCEAGAARYSSQMKTCVVSGTDRLWKSFETVSLEVVVAYVIYPVSHISSSLRPTLTTSHSYHWNHLVSHFIRWVAPAHTQMWRDIPKWVIERIAAIQSWEGSACMHSIFLVQTITSVIVWADNDQNQKHIEFRVSIHWRRNNVFHLSMDVDDCFI